MTTTRRRLLFFSALVPFLSGFSSGKNSQTQSDTASVFKKHMDWMEQQFVPAAEAMPEDKFFWSPTSGEFHGVRSFAEQLIHVAEVNFALSAAILGESSAMGYTYGWRKGDLLKLRARNVNLLTRKIRLDVGTTKNKQGREAAMTAAVAELLRVCLAGKKPDDYVLTRGRERKRVCDARDAWQALCVRAGLGTFVCAKCGCAELKKHKCAECGGGKRKYRGLIPHDLRRSAVKAGRRAGVSEDALMKMGGWKTRAMISRYSIESESDQQATVAALEAQRAREANSPRSAPFQPGTGAAPQPRADEKVQ
jgi:hypothetical protein